MPPSSPQYFLQSTVAYNRAGIKTPRLLVYGFGPNYVYARWSDGVYSLSLVNSYKGRRKHTGGTPHGFALAAFSLQFSSSLIRPDPFAYPRHQRSYSPVLPFAIVK